MRQDNLAEPIRGALTREWQGMRPDDRQDLGDAMASAYSRIAAAERAAKQSFGEIDEASLQADAHSFSEELVARGEIVLPTESARPEVHDLAVLLRALECLRLDCDRSIESDHPGDYEDACRTTDGRHFVLSRLSSFTPRTSQSYSRRALLHHRILPTSIQGFAVRLHRVPGLADVGTAGRLRSGDGRRLGAAFFPGLEVITSAGDGEFTVSALKGFDPAPLIESHVRSARSDACGAVVWAELTMPDEHMALLRASLVRNALEAGSAQDFLVAGSWHREQDGQMRNVAQVLDGSGMTLFEVFKWAKYCLAGRFEAIVPGKEIPILVTESETIVMAICRDFLDETDEPPYCHLDVDLAIVPSMASLVETATMTGHIATARTMSIRHATQSVIVQQPPEIDEKGRAGQLLVHPGHTKVPAVPAEIFEPWSLCQLESL